MQGRKRAAQLIEEGDLGDGRGRGREKRLPRFRSDEGTGAERKPGSARVAMDLVPRSWAQRDGPRQTSGGAPAGGVLSEATSCRLVANYYK